jgi:hypothetical protein
VCIEVVWTYRLQSGDCRPVNGCNSFLF